MGNQPKRSIRHVLPRAVVVLGLVSLGNDAASEMITPLLPVFLTATLGAGPAVVGLVEGLAEATSSVLKLISGRLADRGVSSKRLVTGGYGVSNLARPAMALAVGWTWVLGLRFLDRVGKGLRTAPRDALIATAVAARDRGLAFGFHRAMDHAGAMVGPLLAFALLAGGFTLRQVFLASFVPGALVVALLVIALPREAERRAGTQAAPRLRWRALEPRLRGLIVASGALALATIPEAFLVLWTQTRGLELSLVPLLWAAAHAVKALVSTPAGALSDRLGRVPVVVAGWGGRVLVLILLALPSSGAAAIWGLFLAHAAALAAAEGAERALIGDVAAEDQRATAYGVYHLFGGILVLPGALLFGTVWEAWGQATAFAMAALLTATAASALLALVRRARREPAARTTIRPPGR